MNSSVLWIFLIVAWLFILLPMVLRGRPEVRKTTEAAANTRVLHRGGQRAAPRRASGRHPSNPEYVRKRTTAAPTLKRADIEETDVSKPKSEGKVEQLEIEIPEIEIDATDDDDTAGEKLVAQADLVDLDLDEVEIAGYADAEVDAEVDVESDAEAEVEVTDVIEAVADDLDDAGDDDLDEVDEVEAEFDDDLDQDEAEFDDDFEDIDADVPARRAPVARERRGRGYAAEEIAERDARRYRERQRMVMGLATATVLSIVACVFWQPYGYILLGVMVALTGLYLFFLRRTALAEQEYRAARAARLRRHAAEDARLERQQAAELAARPVAPGRRRPGGMVVLDFDDEDPAFDHLPTYDLAAAMTDAEGLDTGYRRAV